MAKRYELKSEIQRVKAKHPDWELVLDSVPANEEAGTPAYQRKVIKLPASQNMSDDVVLYSNTQPVRAAKLLLGEHWDHFAAAGGTAQVLWTIVQDLAQADLGE